MTTRLGHRIAAGSDPENASSIRIAQKPPADRQTPLATRPPAAFNWLMYP
ncbi:hypothetical protein ACFTSD_23500 [Nocardiaceae bacterium NPDC056970]